MRLRGKSRRRLVQLGGASTLALALVMFLAAPASAHAVLLTSSPAASTSMSTPPEQVSLTFSESVEISLGSIELFNEKGDRVDLGAPRHSAESDRTIEASVPHLDDGAYVLTWRVVSADAHPVHGAFTFTVGRSSVDAEGLATKLEAQGNGHRTVGVLFAIARAFEYAGIALLIGATVFSAAIRPHGRRRSRADALVWVGWIMLFVATVAALLLQGPYAGALPLSQITHTSVVRSVLKTRYGHNASLRLVVLLALLPLLWVVRKTWRPRWWWWVLATPLGLVIAATPGLAGHAAVGSWVDVAVPFDTIHVVAMSVWLGGLASLAWIVLDRDPDAGRAADNFSPVALTSVLVIIATGTFAAWRPGGVVGRRVPRDLLRAHPAREDRGVLRAARPGHVEPERRAAAPAGGAERHGRDRDRGVGLGTAGRPRRAQPALVGGRRGRLRHHRARDHRDAGERATGTRRARTSLLDGVPRADDADRPAHLAGQGRTGRLPRLHVVAVGRESVHTRRHREDEHPVEGRRAVGRAPRARRAQPLHRVRGTGHAGRRHGHVREQVLDPVLGQVADRDPRLRNQFDEVAVQKTVTIR